MWPSRSTMGAATGMAASALELSFTPIVELSLPPAATGPGPPPTAAIRSLAPSRPARGSSPARNQPPDRTGTDTKEDDMTLTNTNGRMTCADILATLSNADRMALERWRRRSEEHTSELQSRENLVCRLLLEKKKHK